MTKVSLWDDEHNDASGPVGWDEDHIEIDGDSNFMEVSHPLVAASTHVLSNL